MRVNDAGESRCPPCTRVYALEQRVAALEGKADPVVTVKDEETPSRPRGRRPKK
jgi:hypothetical protein